MPIPSPAVRQRHGRARPCVVFRARPRRAGGQGDRVREDRHLLLHERRAEGDDRREGRALPADDRRAAQGRQGRRLPARSADLRAAAATSTSTRKWRTAPSAAIEKRFGADYVYVLESGHARRRPAEGQRRPDYMLMWTDAARRSGRHWATSISSTSPVRRTSRATSASTAPTTWRSSTRTSTSASRPTPTSRRPCRTASPRPRSAATTRCAHRRP